MLFKTALASFQSRGYRETTMRYIANDAGVSVGLLYRYFPSKRAVVMSLYEQLTEAFVADSQRMPSGTWLERALFALHRSLSTLEPYRHVLAALVPTLVGQEDTSVSSPDTAFSRTRVQAVFQRAVTEAVDAPDAETSLALGGHLYTMHLALLLFWLLDKSPQQRATAGLIAQIQSGIPLLALSLGFPGTKETLIHLNELVTAGLFAVQTD